MYAWDYYRLQAGSSALSASTVGGPVGAVLDIGFFQVADQPTSAIPEPVTMMGLLAGMGGLGSYLRKRRSA